MLFQILLIQTFTMIYTTTCIEHYFSNVYCKTFQLVPLLLMLLNIQLMIFHIKTLQEKTIKEINICHTTVLSMLWWFMVSLFQYDYDLAQYSTWLSSVCLPIYMEAHARGLLSKYSTLWECQISELLILHMGCLLHSCDHASWQISL